MECSKCGAENPDFKRFCGDCGVALPAAPEVQTNRVAVSIAPSSASGAELPDGERKMVTALFADIKGSTELVRDLDPEEARAIIDPALKLMIDAVHRYDGYVVQSTGDGVFALFGAPMAHEDHRNARCMRPSRCGTVFATAARTLSRCGGHDRRGHG
jgi:class 3 adenylate cyclase